MRVQARECIWRQSREGSRVEGGSRGPPIRSFSPRTREPTTCYSVYSIRLDSFAHLSPLSPLSHLSCIFAFRSRRNSQLGDSPRAASLLLIQDKATLPNHIQPLSLSLSLNARRRRTSHPSSHHHRSHSHSSHRSAASTPLRTAPASPAQPSPQSSTHHSPPGLPRAPS